MKAAIRSQLQKGIALQNLEALTNLGCIAFLKLTFLYIYRIFNGKDAI